MTMTRRIMALLAGACLVTVAACATGDTTAEAAGTAVASPTVTEAGGTGRQPLPTDPPVTGTMPVEVIEGTLGTTSTTAEGPEPCEALTLTSVEFDSGSSQLVPGADQAINQVKERLDAVPGNWRLVIIGHTDSRPTSIPGGNQRLSELRAEAVRDALAHRDVPAVRFKEVGGRANREPVADGDTPEDLAKNRRVEILVYCEAG
jgi:outer membrane protein OmpA-like peptidoglycan-associated protein